MTASASPARTDSLGRRVTAVLGIDQAEARQVGIIQFGSSCPDLRERPTRMGSISPSSEAAIAPPRAAVSQGCATATLKRGSSCAAATSFA
jgi:hypothetical protein